MCTAGVVEPYAAHQEVEQRLVTYAVGSTAGVCAASAWCALRLRDLQTAHPATEGQACSRQCAREYEQKYVCRPRLGPKSRPAVAQTAMLPVAVSLEGHDPAQRKCQEQRGARFGNLGRLVLARLLTER